MPGDWSPATQFCTVALNMRGSSIWNFLQTPFWGIEFSVVSQTSGKNMHQCLTLVNLNSGLKTLWIRDFSSSLTPLRRP